MLVVVVVLYWWWWVVLEVVSVTGLKKNVDGFIGWKAAG